MSDSVYKYYKDLPQWAKGIVVVGSLGIAYIVGNKIYNAFRPKPQDVANVENDISHFQQKMTPSYPDASYNQYADTIYQAQRTSLGNDSGTILDIAFLMKNDLDVAKLIQAYGTRTDYVFGFPSDSYSLLGAMRKGIEDDLWGAFSYRVDKLNKDWESKGIKYRI